MTTPIATSTTDSQMHNNIMAAGSRDRPPMLATGRYAQWRSRFLRYIDTRPNGDALRKCILTGPYTPTMVTTPAVPATEDSPEVPAKTSVETVRNMTPENKAHYESEKEAIHLILTGIGDEIYSTVDACQTAQEMWEAIERLQQGESLNIQDVKTNLFWEFGQFTSHDGEKMESYYTSFYKMMNEMIRTIWTVQDCKSLFQFLQQLSYQNGQDLSRTSSNIRNKNVDTTLRYKNDNQSGQFGNQKAVNIVGAREIVGGPVVQQFGIPCFNCKEFGHYAKECRKPKRVKDSTYHKEKMLLCKQAKKGVQLQAEQSDWLADTDEEIDEQELEAHYSYMAKIQEVPNADSGTNVV
ncbi:retrovirus-related pol polyprotein from transposon TNT 1-94 [Tanacetum coccineum]